VADKTRPASLDKMIALVASLVERSRGPDLRIHLSTSDYNAIAGGKVWLLAVLLTNVVLIFFFPFAGLSIFVSTNQRQYKSTSDTTFNLCTMSMG
jgi:hypothetical protein